jgi:hypothetical protein
MGTTENKKTTKETLFGLLKVVLPAFFSAAAAVWIASVGTDKTKEQAEAGYRTSAQRIEDLEKQVDSLSVKLAHLEGLTEGRAGRVVSVMSATATPPPEPVAAAPKKPRRSPMPENLDDAVTFQQAKR